MVCTDRKTVHLINDAMVRRFALNAGVPVVRWKLPLQSALASRLGEQVTAVMYDRVKDLWGYLVPHCPITLTENLRPERGLSNGTEGFLDSLVLSPDEPVEAYTKFNIEAQGR